MKTVMFVDDDPLILRRLTQLISWEEEGFEIINTSTDGVKALSFIEKNTCPDILICDINMPRMNGLELAKKLIKSYKSIQIIILTVNESFHVSLQALNLGVVHYILKPLNKQELESALKKACQNIDSFNVKENNEKLISEFQTKEKTLVFRTSRNQFLRYLVSGKTLLTADQIQEQFVKHHINFHVENFAMLCVHIDENKKLMDTSFQQKTINEIEMDIEDKINSVGEGVAFCDTTYDFAVLLGFVELYSTPDFYKEIAQTIRDTLKFQLCLSSTIIVSSIYRDLKDIYRCYFETRYFHPLSNKAEAQGIIMFNDYFGENKQINFDFEKTRENIMEALRTKNTKNLSSLINHALYQAKMSTAPDTFRMVRSDLLLTGIIFMKENNISMNQLPTIKSVPVLEISSITDEKVIHDSLNTFYKSLIEYVSNHKLSSSQRITELSIDLIKQNLSNPQLSVNWLAVQLMINENHLSRQFKTQTNIQLVKYIREERLKKAKEMLISGKASINTISEEVGFSDQYYFSKCFKRKYGVSPSNIKKI